ncbi:glycosyltransferase family 2 protein [Arthrobacter halodurans]|uniref:Glycosyltransferase family 2 protein n=1 Tax=Arthrobacter halodurans TaxID=516699 RepID=A0ABV4UNE2_9MICC
MHAQPSAPPHTADCSLLVIVSGRREHLRRLVEGVNRADPRPAEIVVVHMGEPTAPPVPSAVPLRQLHLDDPGGGTLPLAAARNLAAGAASCGTLVFLDVDCIPSRDFFAVLPAAAAAVGGIAMATPRYLGAPLPAGAAVDDAVLLDRSVPHASRAGLVPDGPVRASGRYEMFWTLGFAVDARTFGRIGGFDESFTGYGAEDTDFAFSARELGVPLAYSGATMFHQHHGSHRPPLNHFADIVANARVFREKWGGWPMEGWLAAFAERGLVDWTPDARDIAVLRGPTPDEVAAAAHGGPY